MKALGIRYIPDHRFLLTAKLSHFNLLLFSVRTPSRMIWREKNTWFKIQMSIDFFEKGNFSVFHFLSCFVFLICCKFHWMMSPGWFDSRSSSHAHEENCLTMIPKVHIYYYQLTYNIVIPDIYVTEAIYLSKN